MGKKIVVSVLLFMGAVQSLANDTSSGDENGTLVFRAQPQISMDQERLFISEQEVRVEYSFTNTGKEAVQTQVTFPMPPIYVGLSDHNTIEDFKVWVNEVPQAVVTDLVVKHQDGTDISKAFAASGWQAADVKAFSEDQTPPKQKPSLPKNWFDKDGMPKFTMSHYYSWQQSFPAGQTVRVRHSYRPSLDTGVAQPLKDLADGFAKSACIDPATRSSMKKLDTEAGIGWSYLRYILLTANNWQGPIKDFELTIKKQNPSQLISLCFAGKLKKVDPLTFKFQAKNFTPSQDLNILFLTKPI
jgi:hypothetical protein